MAIIRDMIPAFDLLQPTNVDDALALLAAHGEEAWVLAGGLDSYDWFKDRIKKPKVVIDLGAVPEMTGIRDVEGGLEIGAMTTLTEVARHARVRNEYALLADAAEHVATPQIRNQGTVGGNVAQDTRCWYYRSGWPCYRAGGNTCYAAAFQVSGGTISDARIAVNGVAPYPVRLDAVERLVIGSNGDESVATAAGELAVEGARPLRHNDYKIPMMRNLVRRAVRSAV